MKISSNFLQKNFGWLQVVFGSKFVNKLVSHGRLFKIPCTYIHDVSVWLTSKWCYFGILCEKYLKADKTQQ